MLLDPFVLIMIVAQMVAVYSKAVYSETCLKRTPRGPIFLSALDRCPLYTGYVYETLTSTLIFETKYCVRFKQVFALEHVRFIQALLYTLGALP